MLCTSAPSWACQGVPTFAAMMSSSNQPLVFADMHACMHGYAADAKAAKHKQRSLHCMLCLRLSMCLAQVVHMFDTSVCSTLPMVRHDTAIKA